MVCYVDFLGDDVLIRIFAFVGETRDLINCELVCRRFFSVLLRGERQQNLFWYLNLHTRHTHYIEGFYHEHLKPPEGALTRRLAKYWSAVQAVKLEQSYPESIILGEINHRDWQRVVHRLVHYRSVPQADFQRTEDSIVTFQYYVRGDASAVLVHLVESYMHDFIQAALPSVAARAPTLLRDRPPSLTEADFDFQGRESNPYDSIGGHQTKPYGYTGLRRDLLSLADSFGIETKGKHRNVIRRMARRAGIVKINDCAIMRAWYQMIWVVYHLTAPIKAKLRCIMPVSRDTIMSHEHDRRMHGSTQKLRVLSQGQSFRDVSPFPSVWCGRPLLDHVLNSYVTYYIVAKDITDQADRLRLPQCKVYGEDAWACLDEDIGHESTTGSYCSSCVLQMNEAKEMYIFDNAQSLPEIQLCQCFGPICICPYDRLPDDDNLPDYDSYDDDSYDDHMLGDLTEGDWATISDDTF